jgi:hypothetical protein
MLDSQDESPKKAQKKQNKKTSKKKLSESEDIFEDESFD